MLTPHAVMLVREPPSDSPHRAGATGVRTSELLSEGAAAGSAVPAHPVPSRTHRPGRLTPDPRSPIPNWGIGAGRTSGLSDEWAGVP